MRPGAVFVHKALELAAEAGEVVCLLTPDSFGSVSRWYRDFGQTSDEEVLEALARSRRADRGGE